MKIKNFLLWLPLLMTPNLTYAIPQAGSCADESFRFPGDLDNNKTIIDTTIPVRTLKEPVPLYETATDSVQIKLLEFDKKFKPLKKEKGRIQIGDPYKEFPLGWVDKHDLLCNHTPLDEDGLPRKAFIKIPTAASSNYFIPSYPSPEKPIYGDENKIVRKISRFSTFFIFAEDQKNEKFLLSYKYNLAESVETPLIGWVESKDVIQWKTNLGVRPLETVQRVSGYISLADSGKSLDDRTKGVELTGGKEWYTFPLHIPLLDTEKNHYKVAAPGIGMLGFRASEAKLSKFNDVDLFFLIDGTASMEPYIKAAQKIVEELVQQLESAENKGNEDLKGNKESKLNEDLKEANFRCGFLIYRDIYATNRSDVACTEGLCEYQSLSAETCGSESDISSCQDVIEALSKIKTTMDDNDDYEELLFDGIAKSTSLISPCPERKKYLVVIGDHGDREDKLPQLVIKSLTELKIIPFFIQPNSNQLNANNPEKYRTAYDKFRSQIENIIERMEIKGNLFFSLNADETSDKIATDLLNMNISPIKITELETILATGESVEVAIKKYRSRPQKGEIQGDMSVLFWERVKQEACENLGDQCNKALNHRVNEFFIPIDETKFEKELLLLERHIQKWRKLLAPLTDLDQSAELAGSKKRQLLQDLIIEGFEKVLGEPPLEPTDQRTLEDIVKEKKLAFPVRPKSPLFQYSLHQFDSKNDEKIPDCEVTRILEWITSVDKILEKIVSYPRQKVLVDFTEYEKTECPLSIQGQHIKKVQFKEDRENLGPTKDYRYGHRVFDVTLYWVPLEFLP